MYASTSSSTIPEFQIKARAYELALQCKQSVEIRKEENGYTLIESRVIDERPVLEIAEEIYKWLTI